MWLSANVNLISNTVGQGLAPAVKSQQINGYKQLYFIFIVGANCVRPFLIWYKLTGDRRSPLSAQTNKNKTIIGCYQIEKQMKLKAPSDEGAVVFRRKMTEGEKAINSKFSLSLLPSRLRRATYYPLAVSRFCLCGLERRTKSTAAPTDAPFIRHRRRSHMLPVRGRLYSASIFVWWTP